MHYGLIIHDELTKFITNFRALEEIQPISMKMVFNNFLKIHQTPKKIENYLNPPPHLLDEILDCFSRCFLQCGSSRNEKFW